MQNNYIMYKILLQLLFNIKNIAYRCFLHDFSLRGRWEHTYKLQFIDA